MQATLKVYQEELQIQDQAANQKMIVMMKEKGAAEKQKDLAEKTSSELAIK